MKNKLIVPSVSIVLLIIYYFIIIIAFVLVNNLHAWIRVGMIMVNTILVGYLIQLCVNTILAIVDFEKVLKKTNKKTIPKK